MSEHWDLGSRFGWPGRCWAGCRGDSFFQTLAKLDEDALELLEEIIKALRARRAKKGDDRDSVRAG